MKKIVKRHLRIPLTKNSSAFLWGPRRVGKTYWLRQNYPSSVSIDLLKTDVYAEYASKPALLRERFQDSQGPVLIDEIQKVPALLDEVHWLIENKKVQFLLTGSSPRKLKRGKANLLAGRARRYEMTPLAFHEVQGFDLEDVVFSGLLPPFFLSDDPTLDLRSYVADYLKEEIAGEAEVQNIPAFADFLRVAAITSSELLNYTNVGRETGVSPKVVRRYFQILEDTLLGFRLSPWTRVKDRRLIETEKFYLFDVGLSNYLTQRKPKIGTPEFGKSFEHYILMELKAYQAYENPELRLSFWRTSGGYEVDFIMGDMKTAIEVKGSHRVHEGDIRALVALQEEWKIKSCLVVSLEKEPRKFQGIEILPWKIFLERLWAGDFDR